MLGFVIVTLTHGHDGGVSDCDGYCDVINDVVTFILFQLGPKRIHTVRVRGGNKKYRALRLDVGNFSWGSECKCVWVSPYSSYIVQCPFRSFP